MRWLLLFLTACGGFELDAVVTVRRGDGELQVDGKRVERFEASYSVGSYQDALDDPPLLIVRDGESTHELTLSVAVCGEEDIDSAQIFYVFDSHASGPYEPLVTWPYLQVDRAACGSNRLVIVT